MKKTTLTFSLLLVVLFYSGCSIGTLKLYSGPELSEEQLANVNNSSYVFSVMEFDSQRVNLGVMAPIGESAKENAAILPGVHTFGVHTYVRGVPYTVLEADLKAGKEYRVRAGWQPYPENAIIEGAPIRTVKIDGCRFLKLASTNSIMLYRDIFPGVGCDPSIDPGMLGNTAFTFIDEEGTHLIYLPYLYELNGNKTFGQPVTKVLRLRFHKE